MAQHGHVPKFGNWESGDNAPYTQYFENARKGRTGGKPINPNDPQENPDAFSDNVHQVQVPPSRITSKPETSKSKDQRHTCSEDSDPPARSPAHYEGTSRKNAVGSPQHHGDKPDAFSDNIHQLQAPPSIITSELEASKSKDQHRTSTEDSDPRGPARSPAHFEGIPHKNAVDLPQHHGDKPNSGDPNRRASRPSQGSEHSIERSPLHPHFHAKNANKVGSGSPLWERRGPQEGTHGFAGTPGRSKLKQSDRGDETPSERGSTVPKFGTWDESDPSSADGYSDIFNRVREEKKTSASKVPIIKTDPDFSTVYGKDNSKSSCCSCFGWLRK